MTSMDSYESIPVKTEVAYLSEQEEKKSFPNGRRTIMGVGLCVLLGSAAAALYSGSSGRIVGKHLKQLSHSSVSKDQWQGTQKQLDSWAEYGKPPTLTILPSSEWISCDEYSDDQIAEIEAYATYWENRMSNDGPLLEHLATLDPSGGERKTARTTGFTTFSCKHYSIGLSGPMNGVNPKSVSFKPGKSFTTSPKSGLSSISGDCDYSSGWSCDWDYDSSYTVVSTWAFTLTLSASADFDFTIDVADCDIGCDIGGSIYLSVASWWWSYTYNVWSSPSASVNYREVSLEFSRSVFTIEATFENANSGCCFDEWDMTLSPGFDVSIYDKSYDIECGTIELSSALC